MIQKIEVNLSESILFGLSNVYKTGGMVKKRSLFNIIGNTESLMVVRRNLKDFVEPVLFDERIDLDEFLYG